MKISNPFLLIALTLLVFASCKKPGDNANSATDYTTEYSAQADDQQQVSTEVDAVANDANTALEASPNNMNGGRLEGITGICDAKTIIFDSTNAITKTVTITYSGTSCDGRRTRSGQIILSMAAQTRWRDTGAVLTVTFNNLTITRNRDKKNVSLSGTMTITNVSGGLLRDLSSLHTITHTITSNNMSLTFNNGTQRNWQIAKQRVFTDNGGTIITTTGTHSDGTNSNISEWGTDRSGNAFSSAITEPMVVSQECNYWVTSGQITHTINGKTFIVTFGLDINGNPTSCPGTGLYYFKAQWTNAKGVALQVILPY